MTPEFQPLIWGKNNVRAVLIAIFWAVAPASHAETLSQVLQLALQNNPDVAAAAARIRERQFNVTEAQSDRLPSFTLETGANGTAGSLQSTGTVSITQTLTAFGKIESRIQRAKMAVQSQEAQALVTRQTLIEETALAYGQVLVKQRRVAVLIEQVAQMESVVDNITRRATSGAATQAELRLAELRLAESRSSLLQEQFDQRSALANMRNYTVVPIQRVEPLDLVALGVTDLEHLSKSAIENSALVSAQRKAVDLARAEAEEQRNAGKPSLVARLSRDLNADDTNLGVYLTLGLQGAGRTSAARKGAALARIEAAENALASAITEAEVKAQELTLQLQVQTDLIAVQRDLLISVDATVDSYQRLYEAGQKSWQEVLSMFKERGEKRLALEQAEGDTDLTRLRLASLLGTLAP